jgi:hypothetical protein
VSGLVLFTTTQMLDGSSTEFAALLNGAAVGVGVDFGFGFGFGEADVAPVAAATGSFAAVGPDEQATRLNTIAPMPSAVTSPRLPGRRADARLSSGRSAFT